MSSLLGSIFGGSEENERSNQSLFEKSKALPERPQHKPGELSTRKRTKRDGADSKTISDAGVDTDASKQKKRKKKKTKTGSDSGGDTEDTSKNDPEKDKDAEERTIFVGNLPLTTTRKTLAALFRDCGPVASCRIRSIPVTGIKLPKEQSGNQTSKLTLE